MEGRMGRDQKKKSGLSCNYVEGMKKATKKYSVGSGKSQKPTSRKKSGSPSSQRFQKITERAKQIRAKHPKMKWKNAISQASREIFKK